MKDKIPYPYSLERNETAIRLTIKPGNRIHILHLCVTMVFSLLFIFHISMSILVLSISDLDLKFILISGIVFLLEVFIIFFFIDSYVWKRKGIEVFILYSDRLEYVQKNTLLKSKKETYNFEQIEFYHQLGECFYSEEEAIELGVELDLNKVAGHYPIRFYMDEGKNVIDSEREISVDVIRRIRDEYSKLIKTT